MSPSLWRPCKKEKAGCHFLNLNFNITREMGSKYGLVVILINFRKKVRVPPFERSARFLKSKTQIAASNFALSSELERTVLVIDQKHLIRVKSNKILYPAQTSLGLVCAGG